MPGIAMDGTNANQTTNVPTSQDRDSPDSNIFSRGGNSSRRNGVSKAGSENSTEKYQLANPRLSLDANNDCSPFGSSRESPPPIGHISHGFFPFAWLINRTIQQCWNELADITTGFASSPLRPPDSTAQSAETNNVVSGKTGGPLSDEYVRRKVRLLEFAQAKRADLIKLLVLSTWSRHAAEVSRLIDLQAFIRMRYESYNDVLVHTAAMKGDLIRAQMANPDLKTSLEVLSEGKVGRIPMLGFTSPPALSPKRILKVLRKINKIISMRLLLHDFVPRPLTTGLSICDGRVKFVVPSEFEVELSIAEETYSSQFFFVDLKFLFSPTSNIPKGNLLNNLDHHVNTALMRSGLLGCYDLLHNLTLTLKVLVLFKQARDLSRGHWLDTLRVDLLRRTLIVQYWATRFGPKSWIEVGVFKTSPDGHRNGRGEATKPSLCLRWFRDGVESDPKEVNFNLDSLCMETILRSITSLHISHLLHSSYAKLQECRLYTQHGLSTTVRRSASESGSCCLGIQITKVKQLRVMMDHVTGTTVIRALPPLVNHRITEADPDKSTSDDIFFRICRLRSLVVKEEVESYLKLAGWELVEPQHIKPTDVRYFFPANAVRYLLFARQKSWLRNWVVAFTSSTAGDNWWIVRLRDGQTLYTPPDQFTRSELLSVEAVHPVNSNHTDLSGPLSFSSLAQVANLLSKMVDLHANLLFLAHTHEQSALQPLQHRVLLRYQRASMVLRFRRHDIPPVLQISPQTSTVVQPSIKDTIRLSFHGIDYKSSYARMIANGRLDKPVKGLTISNKACREMAFRCNGASFAMHFLVPVGQPIILPLLTQLQQLEAVIAAVKCLQTRKFVPLGASLTRIDFAYAHSPALRGCIKLNYQLLDDSIGLESTTLASRKDPLFRLTMDLYFPPGNPHRRIKESLVDILNNSRNGLDVTLGLLVVTLPLLQVLECICLRTHNNATPNRLARVRTAKTYQFRYPSVGDQFHILLGRRRDRAVWFLRPFPMPREGQNRSALAERLSSHLYCASGDGWRGVKRGAIAQVEKVQNLLASLDRLIQGHTPRQEKAVIDTQATRASCSQSSQGDKGKKQGLDIITID